MTGDIHRLVQDPHDAHARIGDLHDDQMAMDARPIEIGTRARDLVAECLPLGDARDMIADVGDVSSGLHRAPHAPRIVRDLLQIAKRQLRIADCLYCADAAAFSARSKRAFQSGSPTKPLA